MATGYRLYAVACAARFAVSRYRRAVSPLSSVRIRRVLVAILIFDRRRRERRDRRGGDQGPGEVDQHRAQMSAIAQQRCSTTPPREQERNGRHVALRRVALGTCQHEVVAAVVRRLASTRRDVIQRHHRRLELPLAVRADRPMLGQQPSSRLCVGRSVRRMRGETRRRRVRPVRGSRPCSTSAPLPSGFGLRLG